MTMKTANNRVEIHDGIIEIIAVGDQTVESVEALGREAAKKGRGQWVEGQESLLLDNLNAIGKVPPAALKAVIKMARTLKYDKLAMVSDKRMLKATSNAVLLAIGRADRVQFFDNREDAVKWLKG